MGMSKIRLGACEHRKLVETVEGLGGGCAASLGGLVSVGRLAIGLLSLLQEGTTFRVGERETPAGAGS